MSEREKGETPKTRRPKRPKKVAVSSEPANISTRIEQIKEAYTKTEEFLNENIASRGIREASELARRVWVSEPAENLRDQIGDQIARGRARFGIKFPAAIAIASFALGTLYGAGGGFNETMKIGGFAWNAAGNAAGPVFYEIRKDIAATLENAANRINPPQ